MAAFFFLQPTTSNAPLEEFSLSLSLLAKGPRSLFSKRTMRRGEEEKRSQAVTMAAKNLKGSFQKKDSHWWWGKSEWELAGAWLLQRQNCCNRKIFFTLSESSFLRCQIGSSFLSLYLSSAFTALFRVRFISVFDPTPLAAGRALQGCAYNYARVDRKNI